MMEYVLIRSGRRSLGVQIKEGKVLVRAPWRTPLGEIEAFLTRHRRWIESHLAKDAARAEDVAAVPTLSPEEIRALKDRARRVIPERVAYYAPKVGVTYGKITIRMQRSLWGSCNARGDLSFNCLLMLAPQGTLDSIVVHELCHRKQMNHSPLFYREILRVYPNYYADRRWLKDQGHLLLAAAKRDHR